MSENIDGFTHRTFAADNNGWVYFYEGKGIESTSCINKRKKSGGYKEDKLTCVVNIDSIPEKVDLELQSRIRTMMESATQHQLPTNISEVANNQLPLAIQIMFKIALDEHGKNLRGLWRRLLLFTLESGAQKYHSLERFRSSMHEWLAVDYDEYNKNQQIVAENSSTLYNAAFTYHEQTQIRENIPTVGGLMSWAPGVSAFRSENCVKPLITRTILGSPNIIDPYPIPVYPNASNGEQMYTLPSSDQEHKHAHVVTLETVKHIQRTGGIWLFDTNNLLMKWMHTSMNKFLENLGWSFIRSIYGIEIFEFIDEDAPKKICRIFIHPPLGIVSDTRYEISQTLKQSRSNVAEILRQLYIQLRTGKQEHSGRDGNILFAAHVRLVASRSYHLSSYVSTLIFKDQLVNGNMYTPEHHSLVRDRRSCLIGYVARMRFTRNRTYATDQRNDCHLLQKMVNYISFISSEDLQHAAKVIHKALKVDKNGAAVTRSCVSIRIKHLLEEGRFFNGGLHSVLSRYFQNMKLKHHDWNWRPIAPRLPDTELAGHINILIESLIKTGEWFWIKQSNKTAAENDPPVGSVVLNTWNNRPSKPFFYDDGDHEVEMRFLQRPKRTVSNIVVSSLRRRFEARKTAYAGVAKFYPAYHVVTITMCGRKNNSRGIVRVNEWMCCSIKQKPSITSDVK
jgi:hypothetical protein